MKILKILILQTKWPGGGMVDTADSKSGKKAPKMASWWNGRHD